MAQLTDEQLFAALDPEMNSVAITVKHIAGNMRSRWTDFLTSDGEKPDRNRDCEFVEPAVSRETLMKCWEDGWECLFSALTPLTDADLDRRVTIRGEPHSVMQAINCARWRTIGITSGRLCFSRSNCRARIGGR